MSSSIATKFAGCRLPAVQPLDLSSRAYSSGGFGSDNNSSSIPGRSAEIVSLASIPPPPPSSLEASCFNFAALLSNGIVETWRGTRRGKEQNNNDYSEADIAPASYVKGDSLINGVVGRTTDGGDKTPETTSPDHTMCPLPLGVGISIVQLLPLVWYLLTLSAMV